MNIVIIGTTAYRDKMEKHADLLRTQGHEVTLPAFDDHRGMNELEMCEYNRHLIEQAHEVHVFWDQRSIGTVFDFGMVFALRKPLKIVYIQRKTLKGVMTKYSSLCGFNKY